LIEKSFYKIRARDLIFCVPLFCFVSFVSFLFHPHPCMQLTHEGLMVTSVTNGGTQKLPNKFNIVETYLHDHSLESS
jgi:hypothetical protein